MPAFIAGRVRKKKCKWCVVVVVGACESSYPKGGGGGGGGDRMRGIEAARGGHKMKNATLEEPLTKSKKRK